MNRFLLALAALGFATWVCAQGDQTESAAEKARRFHRNRDLVKNLVTGGLELANEEDPLERAAKCNGMAQRLADEIRLAATRREGFRAFELGEHLRLLLETGVAENLKAVVSQLRPDSPGERERQREQKLRQVAEQAASVATPLEDQLQQTQDEKVRDDLQRAFRTIRAGREEVEKLLANPQGAVPAKAP